MPKISSSNIGQVTVNQCLFGYHDGHRLLHSSIPLPEEIESQLLTLSDLAPGVRLSSNGSYWTGLPLRGLKVYALMRTWLAPEMSRPGCVWSHALLISFTDMAKFQDLAPLMKYLNRPSNPGQIEEFGHQLVISASEPAPPPRTYDSNLASRTVRAIYGRNATNSVFYSGIGELDALIFAIWSQQWPRLRRTFSFRTAMCLSDSIRYSKTFDLSVVVDAGDDQRSGAERLEADLEPWEATTVNDLFGHPDSDLRRFLWRYGSDVISGRKKFHILVDLFIRTRVKKLSGSALKHVIEDLNRSFPQPNDGKTIKDDLLLQGRYSLFPKLEPVDLLEYFLDNPSGKELSQSSSGLVDFDDIDWNLRINDVLIVANRALGSNSVLMTELLQTLAAKIRENDFCELTQSMPLLRVELIKLNYDLLDGNVLRHLSISDAFEIVGKILQHEPDKLSKLFPELLSIDDSELAKIVFAGNAALTWSQIIKSLDKRAANSDDAISSAWRYEMPTYCDVLFQVSIIEKVELSSTLSSISSVLTAEMQKVFLYGPLPWLRALQSAKDDVVGMDRQNFLGFLLSVALANPSRGSEVIFEITFPQIHAYLASVGSSHRVANHLLYVLPDVGWLKNWDLCFRLRLAVVQAYVNNGLEVSSFRRLSPDKKISNELKEIAAAFKNGRAYTR